MSPANHHRRNDIHVIHPVTRAFPATQQCYEASSLPLSVTITPYTNLLEEEQQIYAIQDNNIQSLSHITKCYHCGAPHANDQTYSISWNSTNPHPNGMFCLLCHQVFVNPNEAKQPPDLYNEDNTDRNSSVARSKTPQNRNSNGIDTQLFALPLRLPTTETPPSSLLYSIPAMQCPVLWYICLDGGTLAAQCSYYWQTIATTLQQCLQSAPSHVHVALLIASQRDDVIRTTKSSTRLHVQRTNESAEGMEQQKILAIYDLYSAVPKVRKYSSDELACTEEQILSSVLHAAAPVHGTATSSVSPNISAALRSLMDYPNTDTHTSLLDRPPHMKYRCPVGWVTEVVLASLSYGAVPAGQRQTHVSSIPPPQQLLPYAGVKLTFFLADRPTGISDTFKGWSLAADASFVGGWGGQITTTVIGERYGSALSSTTLKNPHPEEKVNAGNPFDLEAGRFTYPQPHSHTLSELPATELTPQHLFDRYHLSNSDLPNYYADLGRQCSDAAMGVDLLLLFASSASHPNPSNYMNNPLSSLPTQIPDFALPIFLPLAERSGAPGPLLFDVSIDDSDQATAMDHPNLGKSMTRFQREVLSRTPWQLGRVFGAELRVRISPGFVVDPNTVSIIRDVLGPQLAPIYNEDGLIGPASSVDESAQLWRMGTTDIYTSFTLDFALQHKHVRDRVYVDGFGEMNIHPVIQVCFAYTTIVSETDPSSGSQSYKTVRQMRISSRRLSLAYTVEALYATIDTEALAVVLFHRIALASFQDGIIEAASMAQQWLQSLMVCVYRSAMEQLEIEHRYIESGIEPNKHDLTHRYFYPGERLLFLEGELSAEDVLLAQGHERLRPLALMVYLLLQSDPLRLSSGCYRPSYDLRSAALSQMTSMTPSALTRCIAPRLQLWESGPNVMEPIWDVLDLRSDAVQNAILECTSTHKKGTSSGLILFLDTPEQIVVMDARYVIDTSLDGSSSMSSVNGQHAVANRANGDHMTPLVVGVGLQNAIEDAASSYRTRPRIILELNQSQTWGERTLLRLVDHLIEDTPHAASHSENLAEWKAKIAREVQLEIENLSSS